MTENAQQLVLSRNWLDEAALPLWLSAGADRRYGGFFEGLDYQCEPSRGKKRVRVQFRQIYCYAKAGQMGYRGDWRSAVAHGLTFVFDKCLHDAGLCRHELDESGSPLDSKTDLYDQAFMLLAFAEAYKATGDQRAYSAAHRGAAQLFAQMRHPKAGFWDSLHDRSMLRTNPHMHLLEACIAWLGAEPRGVWREIGQISVDLCRQTFIEPEHGGLLEYFDAQWRPVTSGEYAVVEPGHMFEWAWLLLRWSDRTGEDTSELATRLYDVAVRNGICSKRDVAINALDLQLKPLDTVARLWPQTERLKASLALAERSPAGASELLEQARRADRSIGPYFAGLRPGLWRDKSNPDGTFQNEAAPASSFYHLLCAAYEQLGAQD
jgi:mannose/cellobiose epimerase-like protein (N-acyl-D-glucosamine 2-epimerase family)